LDSKSILITGGAGFIGSHLAERLVGEGRRVIVLDNFDTFYDPEIKRRNISSVAGNPAYRLVEGDIRDEEGVEELFASEPIRAVIHLAARAGVRPSIEQPALYTSVNLAGTTTLLEACRRHGAERFIFGSSSSVYGNNEKIPFSEDDPVDRPISPYGATKKAGEVLCHAHHHLTGMKVACLRFFTVFGPRQRPEMAIHKFARLLASGERVDQYGDGNSARDYTFVSDIVEGIVRSLEATSSAPGPTSPARRPSSGGLRRSLSTKDSPCFWSGSRQPASTERRFLGVIDEHLCGRYGIRRPGHRRLFRRVRQSCHLRGQGCREDRGARAGAHSHFRAGPR
jgi:UDP-glucuronate 4-epimerase